MQLRFRARNAMIALWFCLLLSSPSSYCHRIEKMLRILSTGGSVDNSVSKYGMPAPTFLWECNYFGIFIVSVVTLLEQ